MYLNFGAYLLSHTLVQTLYRTPGSQQALQLQHAQVKELKMGEKQPFQMAKSGATLEVKIRKWK